MATLPKWLNDTAETLFSSWFRICTITETEYITRQLKRIRFSTDLKNVHFEPTYAVSIRINDRDARNYSPYKFDVENNHFDILFHLHDSSATGSEFINRLQVGEEIKMLMPRGRNYYHREKKLHIVMGDETSLGTAISIHEASEKDGNRTTGIYELDDSLALSQLLLTGTAVPKNSHPQLLKKINELFERERNIISDGDCIFYISGNGHTLSVIRKFLKEKGISTSQIRSQGYWIKGRRGL